MARRARFTGVAEEVLVLGLGAGDGGKKEGWGGIYL